MIYKRILNRLTSEFTIAKARLHRKTLGGVRFIGITGSAGKTTVKDLVSSILSEDGPCSRTFSSRNELFFVAETVLKTKKNDKYAVIEMHEGHPGAMDKPLKLLKPVIGVVTSIGHDHFKSFRSKEEIVNEVRKLVDRLPDDGIAVLNRDDPHVRKIGERSKHHIIWVGTEAGSTVQLVETTSAYPDPLTLIIKYDNNVYKVTTCLHGVHLTSAVLLSLGVAVAAQVPIELAINAVSRARPPEGRMQLSKSQDGVHFIRDDFKAPYWTIEHPLEFLAAADAARKVAIIGTISDYSQSASKIYKKIAKFACTKADLVVFIGPHSLRALKATDIPRHCGLLAFPEIKDAAAYLRRELRNGDLVLLKGSNKVDHLERLYLDRNQDVTCWTDNCRLMRFCQNCEFVDTHVSSGDACSSIVVCTTLRPASIENQSADIIVIGLGNPGRQFKDTPHNVAHTVLDSLPGGELSSWGYTPDGEFREIETEGLRVLLFKPSAQVNICGPAIRKFVASHGCTHENCILVHDDLDLPLGKIKWKINGGDGGHKGVRSVIVGLGSGAIRRLRVGIKPEGNNTNVNNATYVLRKFSYESELVVREACCQAARVLEQKFIETAK